MAHATLVSVAPRTPHTEHGQEPPADLDWSPTKLAGAAFRTHELRELSPERLEFHPSRASKLFVGGLALTGLTSLLAGLGFAALENDMGALVAGGAVALTLIVLAVLVARLQLNYRVFDRGRGLYWNTHEAGSLREPATKALALDEIQGLQIVAEQVSTPDMKYVAEELNLVLRSGARVCVVDYDQPERIREDAEQLAAWLGVPLWLAPKDKPAHASS